MIALIVAVFVFLTCNAVNAEAPVNLMLITSGGGQYDSSGVEPAVDLAVRLINENDVVPGHRLRIATRGNSSCDRTLALDAFLKNISTYGNKLAVFGCGCSIATEAVAEISHFWNITHFSYTPSSDVFSNHFPSLWKVYPRISSWAQSMIYLMREYNWTMLKIITQEENIFIESTELLIELMEDANITVITNGTNSFMYLNDLDNSTYFWPEVRIYVLNMYSDNARQLMCAAAIKQEDSDPQFYIPGYVWITHGWYQDKWWTEDIAGKLPNCNDTLLEPLMNNTIGIWNGNIQSEISTNVNLTSSEFILQYTTLVENRLQFVQTAAYAYDAVWAFALALNRSLQEIENYGLSVGNFSYATGKNLTELINQQLKDPTFQFLGVSGNVKFDQNDTRVAEYQQILKYRSYSKNWTERAVIAIANETSFQYVNNETNCTVWPEYVPVDGTPFKALISVNIYLWTVCYSLATVGILFALFCLVFNIVFRNRKIVRLISPNLNYAIIAGGIMLYSSVYFYTFSSTSNFLITFSCHFRAWLVNIGYFLCFGTIVAKIWRVYYIFHKTSVGRKKWIPKDWHLFLAVVLMCSVIVVILLNVAIFSNYEALEVEDKETPQQRNDTTKVFIKYSNLVCEGPYSLVWIFFLYGLIAITQVMAVILAFLTRNVTIKALNDSRYLTVIIYISTVILVTLLICAVLINKSINADAAVFGVLIFVFTTVVLGLTFIPKMIILYKDPKGEKIFDRGQSQGTLNLTAIEDTKLDQVNGLERHCQDLEDRLGKYETVTPFRSLTRSSSIKYSTSTGYTSPTSSLHPVNPLSSITPDKQEVASKIAHDGNEDIPKEMK